MHYYQSNPTERQTVNLLLGAGSIPLAWALNYLLKSQQWDFWWLEAPSVMGFYALLNRAFATHGWKSGPLRRIGLVETPIFAGEWAGVLRSSHDGASQDHPVFVKIVQSFDVMQVTLRGMKSASRSLAASVVKHDATPGKLHYLYTNFPEVTATRTMEIHEGTCELELSADGMRLEGKYYSGRGRQNFGDLALSRQP